MSESTGIRISELTPADEVGTNDLFIVSQFNDSSGTPDSEKYISKKVTSDILSKHLLDKYSDQIEEKISEELGRIGDLGDIGTRVDTISTDLDYAISAILGLDACRQKFKGDTTLLIGELSDDIDQTRKNLSNTIQAVSTYLSTETIKTIDAVSSDIMGTISEVSGTTMSAISNVSVSLTEHTETIVNNISVQLSTNLTKTIDDVSSDCLSIMELCVNTVSSELREDVDYNRLHIDRIETLSISYDKDTNDIVLTETVNAPEIYARLNRDDIFIDLLSDLTLDSMVADVKCDRKNLSVWFNVGNPQKKRPIVFPLSTFHHNYVFDKPNSGLSVDHPISGNMSVGVDFGCVSGVMSESFYTKSEIDENIYTKSQTDELLEKLSVDVVLESKDYVDNLVSDVSAETLKQAKRYTDQQVKSLDDQIDEIINQISSDILRYVDNGDAIALLSAKNYTDEAVVDMRSELTSFVDTRISDITSECVRNDNLSTQTWYLYTDNAPMLPIPFNIVLSVETDKS